MVSRRCATETCSCAAKSSATMRFSATVMLLNGRGIWKLRAMPRRVRICGCNDVMSSSRNRTVPGSVRNAPEMQLISVVFPEPFGPIRPKRSPGRISTLTLSTAVKPPKRLVSDAIRSRGAWASGGVMLRPPCDCRAALRIRPMMPSGAPTTNNTSITPSISTFTSDEMVTVSNCCVVAQQDRADDRAGPMRGSADQRHRQRRNGVVEIERGSRDPRIAGTSRPGRRRRTAAHPR